MKSRLRGYLHVVPDRRKALALRLEDRDAGRLEAALGHADAGVADPALFLRGRTGQCSVIPPSVHLLFTRQGGSHPGEKSASIRHFPVTALNGAFRPFTVYNRKADRQAPDDLVTTRASPHSNPGQWSVGLVAALMAAAVQLVTVRRSNNQVRTKLRPDNPCESKAHRVIGLVAVGAEPGAGSHGLAHVLQALAIAHVQARAAEAARRCAAARALRFACGMS